MTRNRQAKRRARRAAAVDRSLLRHWRQGVIEEELSRLLTPSLPGTGPLRQSTSLLSPSPFLMSGLWTGNAGPDPVMR